VDRQKPELADIVRRYGKAYLEKFGASVSAAQRRVMKAIESCRTAVLGGHVEVCDRCRHQRVWYNSCSNRHCPKCQSLARAQWLEDRESELLDTAYLHVVFTVPEQIAEIALQNKRAVYGILFRATAETLQTIAADPKHLGAHIGFFAVLEKASGEQLSNGDYAALYQKLTGASLRECPICREGRMVAVGILAPSLPESIDSS
jgi:transposase-like zinc-binding protein